MAALVRRAALGIALLLVAVSCRRTAAQRPEDTADAGATAAPVVTDSTEGLLFAWIDDKGEFHLVEKPTDVPIVGRDVVRVMDPVHYDTSNPDRVFIADLRVAGADGSYPVRAATRGELDAVALARRAKTGPTLASAARPASPAGEMPGATGPSAAQSAGSAGTARPLVIIYGASWCGACHQAAAYLKQKGVAFVEKDIEADANAAREMQAKLARVGKRGGSIPVLDVRGRIMVGFNPQEVDSALGQAL